MNPNPAEPSAYIALGSNLGERAANIALALRKLEERGIQVLKVSQLHETLPVGAPPGTEHLHYLNAAAALRTSLTPKVLLSILLEIEKELGRQRTAGARNAPRNIDLDLLLYGDCIEGWKGFAPATTGSSSKVHFCLPHPRMHQRDFVLRPLAEIAAEVRHPVFGKSIAELLAEISIDP